MPDREFRIETGKRGGDSSGLAIQVREVKSGELVMLVNLSAAEAFDVLTGGTVHVVGKQSPNLDRIGKTMRNESHQPPKEDIGYPMPRDEQLAATEAWGRKTFPDWESYETRMTNSGPLLVIRKWIADEDGEG